MNTCAICGGPIQDLLFLCDECSRAEMARTMREGFRRDVHNYSSPLDMPNTSYAHCAGWIDDEGNITPEGMEVLHETE